MACWASCFVEQPRNRLCWASSVALPVRHARHWATFISDRTDNRLAGPATARHKRMGMKKALPKEYMVEMQNPHRWIAPRGAAARPKGLEPPTF